MIISIPFVNYLFIFLSILINCYLFMIEVCSTCVLDARFLLSICIMNIFFQVVFCFYVFSIVSFEEQVSSLSFVFLCGLWVVFFFVCVCLFKEILAYLKVAKIFSHFPPRNFNSLVLWSISSLILCMVWGRIWSYWIFHSSSSRNICWKD